ncbi:MAG TPA: DUF2695 domain-containing protein [Marmoricola sp.]|nr:DUF2695 domain-containing protein [Marmoricola sp.]
MSDPLVVLAAESWLRDRAHRLTEPDGAECLFCFVARMLDEHGCDTTLRWATRYRDLQAPRATALERRLSRMGGFCDCEIFLNGMMLAPRLVAPPVQPPPAYAPAQLPGATADETYDALLELLEAPPAPEQQEIDELEAIAELEMTEADADVRGLPPRPPCPSVRRGSTRPCTHWVRQPRW